MNHSNDNNRRVSWLLHQIFQLSIRNIPWVMSVSKCSCPCLFYVLFGYHAFFSRCACNECMEGWSCLSAPISSCLKCRTARPISMKFYIREFYGKIVSSFRCSSKLDMLPTRRLTCFQRMSRWIVLGEKNVSNGSCREKYKSWAQLLVLFFAHFVGWHCFIC